MLRDEVPWLQVEHFPATDGGLDKIPQEQVAMTWNTRRLAQYSDFFLDARDEKGTVLRLASQYANPGVTCRLSPGERGCAHSHLRMWQRVVELGRPALILEDDATLPLEGSAPGSARASSGGAFGARLALGMAELSKKEVDLLYLSWAGHREGSYKHLREPRGKRSLVVRKAEYIWTTAAYVLWPRGAKRLLELARPVDQPLDHFIGWHCREGHLEAYVLLGDEDTDSTWAGGVMEQVDPSGDSDVQYSVAHTKYLVDNAS